MCSALVPKFMASNRSSTFGEPCLGRTAILEPPISVMFSLFLISTHFENLIHLNDGKVGKNDEKIKFDKIWGT